MRAELGGKAMATLIEELRGLVAGQSAPQDFLSFKDAAGRLGVSTKTVRRMVATGRLVAYEISRTPKIAAKDLLALSPIKPKRAVSGKQALRAAAPRPQAGAKESALFRAKMKAKRKAH